jgi:hypothetical protein
MPAWIDQDEAETTEGFKPSCCEGAAGANCMSAQPCGCDPGCRPKPHVCEQHRVQEQALDILEAIIYASDGCQGHADCAHSMKPWQRARAFLQIHRWREV